MIIYITVERVGYYNVPSGNLLPYDVLGMMNILTSADLTNFTPIDAAPEGLPAFQSVWPDIGQTLPMTAQFTPAFYVIDSQLRLVPFRLRDLRITTGFRLTEPVTGQDYTSYFGIRDASQMPTSRVLGINSAYDDPFPLQAMVVSKPVTDEVRGQQASSNLFVPGFPSRNRNVGLLSDGLVGAQISSSQFKRGWTFHLSPECQIAGQTNLAITPFLNVPGSNAQEGFTPYNTSSLIDFNGIDVRITARTKIYMALNVPDGSFPSSGTAFTESYCVVPIKQTNYDCQMYASTPDSDSYIQRQKTQGSAASYSETQAIAGFPLSVIASGSELRADIPYAFKYTFDDGLLPDDTLTDGYTVIRASGRPLNPYSEEIFGA